MMKFIILSWRKAWIVRVKMSSITNVIQECIHPDFMLQREKESWVVREDNPGAANKKLLVNGNGIYGFSLDTTRVPKPVWKFLQSSSLSGVCSVCDGIFVTSHKEFDYFIVIDLKSFAGNGAVKQVITGIYLCNWIYSVLKLHGHLSKNVKFIGVISKLSRRNQSAKKSSTRSPLPAPEIHHGYPVFKLENYTRLSLKQVVEHFSDS